MELNFRNSTVFIDTAPFIYFIEGSSRFSSVLGSLFLQNQNSEFQFVTSVITLAEELVHPLRAGNPELANQYKQILTNSPGLSVLDVTQSIAVKAAELRATYNLRTPDSLLLATALLRKCDFFLTHDLKLKVVQEISIVTLDDL